MFYVISHANVGANCYDSQHIDSDAIGVYTSPAKHNSSGEVCIKGWCGTTNDIKVTAHGAFETEDQAIEWIEENFEVRQVEDIDNEHKDLAMLFKFGKYAPMSSEQVAEAFYEEIDSIHHNSTDEELEALAQEIEEKANAEGFTTTISDLDLEAVRNQKAEEIIDETDLRFELIEDNSGGLHLYVLTADGIVVYVHHGFELSPKVDLLECIKQLKDGTSVKEIFANWDGCSEGNLNSIYENIQKSEHGYTIVAVGEEDEINLYLHKMGRNARSAFDVFEDEEGELFIGMSVKTMLGV